MDYIALIRKVLNVPFYKELSATNHKLRRPAIPPMTILRMDLTRHHSTCLFMI
jgi:hypothetical protein